MYYVGIGVAVLGVLGWINGSTPPPGTDPATAAGMSMGPYLWMAVGGLVMWFGSKNKPSDQSKASDPSKTS
jgi:hypothetical protein